ncbi:glucokinase [Virgisporangium aliadipatigenens]|uniref:Glucokinase n=1 Tax=Virgisporangium aliadipatigenens TaxID=741659 RepID=A0A8J3YU25_9ACTN|nr:ROK family glucokinase [Virgisporangium aliadipatigenens]GIJ49821.1 glucokinase [Virgisporangium aliadipatigenens]
MNDLAIGVDIGGTKVLGAVVDLEGEVLARCRRDTPAQDTAEIVDRIVEVIEELRAAHPSVGAVGVGAAGWIDPTGSTVLFAANLAWRNEPLRDHIQARVDLPAIVENDGNVAAWAEFSFGAARDADDSMVLFTVGTGIGGGIVIGGNLIRGAHGIAGEVGHTMMVPDGHPCGCGRKGCMEQYASGNALVRFARTIATEDPDSASVMLELAAGKIEAINGPTVTKAAHAGCKAAVAAFDRVAYWLAVGLADTIQNLDPQVIVVGGGVVEAGDLLMVPTREYLREALAQRGRLDYAEVRPALMGNHAGVIGAADLARKR